MNKKKIVTAKEKKNNPAVVFLLSLIVTGTGQFMTNNGSRAAILFLTRNLLLLTAAYLPAGSTGTGQCAGAFIVLCLLASVVTLYSPIQASISALTYPVISLKSYNRTTVLIILLAVGFLLNLLTAFVITGSVRFAAVTDDTFSPVAQKGEIILLSAAAPKEPERGSAVLLSSGKMTRIIAVASDTVEIKNNIVYVNGFSTQAGILSDDDHKALSIGYYAGLFKGASGINVYPVVIAPGSDINDIKPVTVNDKQLFVCGDFRTERNFCEIVSVRDISGTVCGVVISGDILRVGAPSAIQGNELSQLE